MILVRTPFRVSIAGGGSDVQWFYRSKGQGKVLNMGIRRYMYIAIHPYLHPDFRNSRIRLKYSQTEDVGCLEEIKHPIIRESLRRLDLPHGMEIASFADIPAGTGLGSSSSFTVGLLHGLYGWKGEQVERERIAREACEIEIQDLKSPIGKQDQYAAAHGGVNVIHFNADESVEVSPVGIDDDRRAALEQSLRLYYLNNSRSANEILSRQNSANDVDKKYHTLSRMIEQVEQLQDIIQSGDIADIGPVLDEGWRMKKQLDKGIANSDVDMLYEKAMRNGATGGKLLGAGGTGFLLLQSKDHARLEEALGCTSIPLEIDSHGSRILFNDYV